MSNPIITPELVVLDKSLGATSNEVIKSLAQIIVSAGRAKDFQELLKHALEREALSATGMSDGIAIPHCRSVSVLEPTIALARLATGVDFGSVEGLSDLIFFIAVPEGANDDHLKLLSALARNLVHPEFIETIRQAKDPVAIISTIEQAIAPSSADTKTEVATSSHGTVLVAVTSCPTGIAHTYMAADALKFAAEEVGVELHVETQGSAGVVALDASVIAKAQAVIFAVDVDVRDRNRFAGKPVVQAPVKKAIDDAKGLIEKAVAAARSQDTVRVSAENTSSDEKEKEHAGSQLKRWLLTGVSYMIPFVAGGGLLIALGFLLGGYDITESATDIVLNNTLWNLPSGGLGEYLGAAAFIIGAASMGFLVPALSGYIAFAIADRPGIAVGFTAGAVALVMRAGFLGGLIGGLLAGFIALALTRVSVPAWLRGLMPVVIVPLVGSIFASGLIVVVLGGPIAWIMTSLDTWLGSFTGVSAALLGAILGIMMAADLGGPINKVAYAFAVAGLGAGTVAYQTPWMVMAAVMAAGMVPPLAMALATVLDRKLFSPIERENGKAAWLLGASFISEGAIPFAAADPLRVIPAGIVGGAVTGAIAMGAGVTSQAPHGGIFVFFAIGQLGMFILSILVGMVVTALIVIALKRMVLKKNVVESEQAA